MFKTFFRWCLNKNGQKPKYQNIPYQTRAGYIVPADFEEDQENLDNDN